jgi:hypothetical protein
MNPIKVGVDALIIILFDWIAYVFIKNLSDATPGYGYFGWPLYIAANIVALYLIKQKYFK